MGRQIQPQNPYHQFNDDGSLTEGQDYYIEVRYVDGEDYPADSH